MKAFISYSHNDSKYLDRLHIHLSNLKREGKITTWYDRDILAGGEINTDISAALEGCDLFIALVSPDFIASSYCVEKEMLKAIELHNSEKCRLVPIIIEPCDWQQTPLQKYKALPKDGKPISEWQNENTAFLDVVTELRRIADTPNTEIKSQPSAPNIISPHSSERGQPKYRIKRDFDEIDKADFRESSFQDIKKYMESSIAEINGIENVKARFSSNSPNSFSCTILNKVKDRGLGALTVHMKSGTIGFGDIYYSNSENAPANTSNGGFKIESDEYDLYLTHSFSFSSNQNERLTAKQAAEILWETLLEQSGVCYA